MSNVIEKIIYIHGVSNEPRGKKHDQEYKRLHNGIKNKSDTWPDDYIGIEWGWNYRNVSNPKDHELLTKAQRHLGRRAIKDLDDSWDFTINPARLFLGKIRNLEMYGFADMFYYVSMDGKKAVRNTVIRQIIKNLGPEISKDDNISLTILGHSAGSVVAFDVLFYLFFGRERDFLLANTSDEEELKSELLKLRKLAQNNRLRIRRLITFGSPITFTAYRSNAILEILSNKKKLDPVDYGLDRNPASFGPPLKNPRWINIWDKDDPIAWAVEPLMKQGGRMVKDIYIDVSDSISKSHNEYWSSEKMHKIIGKIW